MNLARAAALLAPIPALGLLLLGLSAEVDDAREGRNAGLVIGGMLRRDGIGKVMQRVVRRPFRVWVLGNSNANTDIDTQTLAELLEIPDESVAVLSIPNANAAHWVAMLRKLRAAPRRPDLVLVVSRLQLVLVRDPISEGARRSLQELLGPDDDDLRTLANPAGAGAAVLLQRREALRDRVGRELRALAPLALGIPRSEAVLRRALSDDRVSADLLGPPPSRPLPAPEDSLVPELGALAQDLGIRLVVTRPPASPLTTGHLQGDVVPDGYPERTRALLAAHGAEYVDLRALPMQRYHYRNVDHLSEEGAQRLTGALGAYLAPPEPGLGALGQPAFQGGEGGLTFPSGELTYAAPPPALDGAATVSEPGTRDGVGWAEAPAGVPTDLWTMARTPLRARCSPVRVVGPAGPLDAGWPCKRLLDGTSCHGPERVGWMHAPPLADGAWHLALDPGRSCDGAAWLYPGDRLTIRWPPIASDQEDGAEAPTHVLLEAALSRPRAARVHAVVREGPRVVAEGRLPGDGPLVLELPSSLREPGATVVVRLRSDSFALLTRARLVRR